MYNPSTQEFSIQDCTEQQRPGCRHKNEHPQPNDDSHDHWREDSDVEQPRDRHEVKRTVNNDIEHIVG